MKGRAFTRKKFVAARNVLCDEAAPWQVEGLLHPAKTQQSELGFDAGFAMTFSHVTLPCENPEMKGYRA